MHRLAVIVILSMLAVPVMAQARPGSFDTGILDEGGQFDAVTVNGMVLPVSDLQQVLQAGIIRLDPATRRFSLDPAITRERQFNAALRGLPLTDPLALKNLYRRSKVALPNGAAHELTVPSGFGPARFGGRAGVTLSGSLGGVSRVPWTSQGDGALGLGLGFGNGFNGIGASLRVSFNDLSRLGNGNRMSWSGSVSHYVADGLSVAVGAENLFAGRTDGTPSYYLAGSWAFDAAQGLMPFDGAVTLGAGSGRFARMTPRDRAEGKAANASAVFASLSWEASPSLNLIAEWNGRNLNAGLGYTLPRSGISVKLGVENLTDFSGNGPILTGSVGMVLARF